MLTLHKDRYLWIKWINFTSICSLYFEIKIPFYRFVYHSICERRYTSQFCRHPFNTEQELMNLYIYLHLNTANHKYSFASNFISVDNGVNDTLIHKITNILMSIYSILFPPLDLDRIHGNIYF